MGDIPLSERGNPLLWYNNRLYVKGTTKMLANKRRRVFWLCKHIGCKGNVTKTETGVETELYGETKGKEHLVKY
jgi:hypothetical protein